MSLPGKQLFIYVFLYVPILACRLVRGDLSHMACFRQSIFIEWMRRINKYIFWNLTQFLPSEDTFCHVIDDRTLAPHVYLNTHRWLALQRYVAKVLLVFLSVLSHYGNSSASCPVFQCQKIKMHKLKQTTSCFIVQTNTVWLFWVHICTLWWNAKSMTVV